MSDQIIPFGGTVEVSTDGSTWSTVPECKGIPVPTTTQEYPEVTNLDSPNGFREYIAGLKDIGELTFQAGYTPAGFALLDGLIGTLAYWRVTFPQAPSQSTAGDVFTYRGFPVPSVEADDVGAPVNISIGLRGSGNYVYTQGS